METKQSIRRNQLKFSVAMPIILASAACSASLAGQTGTPVEIVLAGETRPAASNIPSQTPTSISFATPLPTAENELLRNPDFESGIAGWDIRYGEFLHSSERSHTGLGSGRLITSTADARGDYSGLVGQCVSLTTITSSADGEGNLVLEVAVYVDAAGGGSFIDLAGVFTDADNCRGAQVGTFSLPAPDQGSGWVLIEGEIDVPPDAASLDLLISCSGVDPNSNILIDDAHLSPRHAQ